ncbi:hypothetical protein CRI94_16630 [Longibacter salinarum]|uniref:ASPIC/UnbV domain-containing protein n=1 Tax=Longibacter salinarum TaxID=1850348 RepID=A0A2A8CTZ0_9BACT|nr:CRTAC1 family protein [Longibacter salinarum]PEN11210.1 hypothetical protein CRI94_16630 [Longibacter salinarum]
MFRDATSLINKNPVQRNYGVAVGQLRHQGEFELLVAGYTGRNLVFAWDGTRFTELETTSIADSERQAIGIASADVNGDGTEEVYVLNTDTFAGRKRFADRLFAGNGSDAWTNLFDDPENERSRNLTAGRSVAVVDRTGNGRYGFFVANYGGPMRLYEVNDRHVVDVAEEAGVALSTGGRGVIAAPILTPQMDIFCVNENGPNFLFENQGDGTFKETAARRGVADRYEHGRGVDAIDHGEGGPFGVVYGNWQGRHRLFAQQSGGSFLDVTPDAMASPSRVRTVIAADFDNDGYQEVFFNNIGEPNRLFAQRDGSWVQIDAGDATEPQGLGTGAAVADFDGDGRLELFVAHGETGAQPLSLYHSRGASDNHHYIRIAPLTKHGAPARGAVVTCTASGRTQRRNVDAGSGYLCQMEPVAHFGLGTTDTAEEVEVRWPDGTTHRLEEPEVDQLHSIPYPN